MGGVSYHAWGLTYHGGEFFYQDPLNKFVYPGCARDSNLSLLDYRLPAVCVRPRASVRR